MMHGKHEFPLVALSIVIAICASYTALTLAGRVSAARGRARLAWLLGGSVAMGSGIWSMHFVAMLACHLPVPMTYDVVYVGLSFLAAVGASAFALFVASRVTVGFRRLIAAGICLGLAVVTMHYTGMAAVRVEHVSLTYDHTLVAASVLIAITAATVALWLFLWLRNDNTRRGRLLRAAAAVVMGLAIAGMHYTAMSAVMFVPTSVAEVPHPGMLIGTTGLAVPVVMGAFLILTLTVAGSIADRWIRTKLEAAEAIAESEERYRSVVSEIDEVIFRADASGRWTFLNSAWPEITGFEIADSLGRAVQDFVYEEDHAEMCLVCRPTADNSADYGRREVRFVTKDGSSRWMELHARVTRTAAGTLAGTAGVIRDVTERRRAEEALRAAREAADAASRAKSEFLSRMSHELRTPLNAILGFGQLMELDAVTDNQRENTEQILKAGRHLLSLINEVLDITGIESGHLSISAEPVRVGEVVQEIVDLIGPLTTANEIRLAVDMPTVVDSYVFADRQRLKQVLLNLAANAIKYNRQGGSVRIGCIAPDSGSLRIFVEDTGPGIPAEKMERLFTPFERLGAEQAGVEGTGLGLALSKRLAEAMKGRIGLESTVGSGTTFWIELPRAESQMHRLARLESDTPVVGATAPASGQRTVLYVEDNLSNLTLVQRILESRPDIRLIPAMQGGLALELARLHQPDLVLLDLHLPDIPGEEVLRQLRHSTYGRNVAVMVLSADATHSQADRLLAAGAHAYMTKPLDVKSFIRLLDEMLDQREAA